MSRKPELLFFTAEVNLSKQFSIPFVTENISAGFPSPADNYLEGSLDLNSYLIKNPPATFFVKVAGDSMVEENIQPGDVLIVDRSIEAKNGDVVIAVVDGEFTVKKLFKSQKQLKLIPGNKNYSEIIVTPEMEFEVWGIVTNVIHKFK